MLGKGELGGGVGGQRLLLLERYCALFGRLDPLEFGHLVFVLVELVVGELDHPEEGVDVVDVAFAQGLGAHVLEEVRDADDADEFVPHHRTIPVVHVLREAQGVLLLGVLLLDLVLEGG